MKTRMSKGTALAAGLLAAALLVVAVPVVARADGGGDVLLSAFEWYDYDVTVAYNSHAQEFLAVWSHSGVLYGQRYDEQGIPRGEEFPIAGTGDAFNPAVAYALAPDLYLVAWEARESGSSDIEGQLLDVNGVLLGAVLTLDDHVGEQTRPDVATSGADFLVVWQHSEGGAEAAIRSRGVTGGGVAAPAIYTVAEGGATREQPAVAYSETAGEYLVVFRWGEGATAEIHARRVATDGTQPGFEYGVADAAYAGDPDLAATPWGAGGAYVVVWSDFRDGDYNIYGRVVIAGADDLYDGTDVAICGAAGSQQLEPAIARSSASGRFLVTWQDDRADAVSAVDIYGQRLTDDANLDGDSLAISTAAGDQLFPALAAGQSPDAYLVAWEDNRNTPPDIQGQRVASNGSLLWYEFAVSAQPEAQEAPAVAYNHEQDQYLAVWQDQREGHWTIRGQRLSAGGQPLEEPWAIEADGHDNVQPSVAYSGARHHYVVVWADLDLDKLEGRQVPVAGDATLLFSVLDSDGGRRPCLVYNGDSDRFLVAWDNGDDVYSRGLLGDGLPVPEPSTNLAGGAGWQGYATIAYDSDNAHFLVAWQDDLGGTARLYGRLAAYDGTPLGFAFPIAGGDGTARLRPAAAYQPASTGGGAYLVVYEYQAASKENDIRGRRLEDDGTPLDEELVIRDEPAGADQAGPDAIYAPQAGQYYVVWSEYRDDTLGYDLYGQMLDATGNPSSTLLPFFSYPGDQRYPQVAFGEVEQGLMVWHDTRRSKAGDVYARLGTVDLEPPVARFTVDPTAGPAGSEFRFDARPSSDNLTPPGALRVRWDWTSDGTWDTPLTYDRLATQTVLAPGVYQVSLQAWDLMLMNDTVSHTIYVLDPGANTPPTAVLAASPLVGVAGTSFQFDASGSTDGQTPAADLQVRWDWENDGTFDTLWSSLQVRAREYSTAGLHTVHVEVRDAGGLMDAATRAFLVLPGDVLTLTVTPDSAKLTPGSTVQFRATAWDSNGNEMSNPAVTWSVNDPLAGTISARGVLTAGVGSGVYAGAVLATSNGAGDSATVVIVRPYGIYLPLMRRE